MLLIKNDGHLEFIKDKKSWSGCHHILLVYDASKLTTVYLVKSPVLGLQRAIFQKNQDFVHTLCLILLRSFAFL